jgi:hypothetical protein
VDQGPVAVGDALPWKRLLSYFEFCPAHLFPVHFSCKKPRTRAQQQRPILILGSRTPLLLGMRCPARDPSPILSFSLLTFSLPTFPAKSLGHVHSSSARSWSSDQGPRCCWGCVALKETPLLFWVFPCPPFPAHLFVHTFPISIVSLPTFHPPSFYVQDSMLPIHVQHWPMLKWRVYVWIVYWAKQPNYLLYTVGVPPPWLVYSLRAGILKLFRIFLIHSLCPTPLACLFFTGSHFETIWNISYTQFVSHFVRAPFSICQATLGAPF